MSSDSEQEQGAVEQWVDVLFEFGGSRREVNLNVANVCGALVEELKRHGISNPVVTCLSSRASSGDFFLQKWDKKWQDYVDVQYPTELNRGDKITVVKKQAELSPKVPHKNQLICNSHYTTLMCYLHRERKPLAN